jgi:hypothetical protein
MALVVQIGKVPLKTEKTDNGTWIWKNIPR